MTFLFIDSSHTVKIGGDVNYLFLEVLPRLKPGVIVHVHDIFFPFEYRRDWVLEEFRFWTEQYLLQAFLIFNSEFEVLMANSYLNHYYQQDLESRFSGSQPLEIPGCLRSPQFRDFFQNWERHGFHVTPARFNQPIPDTQSLPETLWSRPSELVGIQMNEAAQLNLLESFSKFRDEYQQFPTGKTQEHNRFYLGNGLFDGVDALVAYCMIRHFQPRLIIEVGSGFSSLVLGQAVEKNKNSGLICIEPFPREFLREGFPGLQSLIEKKVQDIDLEFFSQLGSGDILFIDSSHTVKIGSDVNYLFLEVLPRLNPGVIVHVHDIFLPFEYRRDWVLDEFRFWTEQYLLQAFLTFNSEFEVLLANYYLSHYHQEHLRSCFSGSPSLDRRQLLDATKAHR